MIPNARGVRLTSVIMSLDGQSILTVDLPWANGIIPSTTTRILGGRVGRDGLDRPRAPASGSLYKYPLRCIRDPRLTEDPASRGV